MPTLAERHQEIVEQFLSEGEPIVKSGPKYQHILKVAGRVPDAYIKSGKYRNWVGTLGYDRKNGNYVLIGEMCSWLLTNVERGDIGLCDPGCFYEWPELKDQGVCVNHNPQPSGHVYYCPDCDEIVVSGYGR